MNNSNSTEKTIKEKVKKIKMVDKKIFAIITSVAVAALMGFIFLIYQLIFNISVEINKGEIAESAKVSLHKAEIQLVDNLLEYISETEFKFENSQYQEDIEAAKIDAYNKAKLYANEKIGSWFEQFDSKMPDLVNQYCDFLNIENLSYVVFQNHINNEENIILQSNNSLVDEKITEDLRVEFSRSILEPHIASIQLEVIISNIVSNFIYRFTRDLRLINNAYEFPVDFWNSYLTESAINLPYATESSPIKLSEIINDQSQIISTISKYMVEKANGTILNENITEDAILSTLENSFLNSILTEIRNQIDENFLLRFKLNFTRYLS